MLGGEPRTSEGAARLTVACAPGSSLPAACRQPRGHGPLPRANRPLLWAVGGAGGMRGEGGQAGDVTRDTGPSATGRRLPGAEWPEPGGLPLLVSPS